MEFIRAGYPPSRTDGEPWVGRTLTLDQLMFDRAPEVFHGKAASAGSRRAAPSSGPVL